MNIMRYDLGDDNPKLTSPFQLPIYKEVRKIEEERDNILLNPVQVEDGVLQCSKCKSFKTVSYQRQTRSADEGMTTFSTCTVCIHRWKHNN